VRPESLNVLITAGSRRVPLLRAFQRAVRALSPRGSVVVTDVNALSPAVYAADRSYEVPLATDEGYLDEIAAVCQREHIGLVVPTIDDELTVFAEAVDRFAAMGVRILVSPPETTSLCDDKFVTCETLQSLGIDAATSYLPDGLPADPAFPLFIKPRVGRGGVGAFPVRNARELAFFSDYVANPVIQTFLDGPEFTIDLLCDWAGEPIAVVPRERVVVRAGVVDRGRTVAHPALIQLGLRCARALRFVGAVNIQCRVVHGRPVVFEINPRFSGGIPLTIAAGADFPRWIVDLALGRDVAPAVGRFFDDVWMTNYESSMFISGSSMGFTGAGQQRVVREVA
jgi:carbamoyl-phosphate synthase large subunit